MNKEDLVDEISKDNVSLMGFYNSNGNNMLYTQKYVEEKNKEIERLNNIINELEKYINKMIKEDSKYNDVASRYGVLNCKNILVKLKELKEGK